MDFTVVITLVAADMTAAEEAVQGWTVSPDATLVQLSGTEQSDLVGVADEGGTFALKERDATG